MGLANSKQNQGYKRQLYTGITLLKPVLINPTVAELRSKGVDTDTVRQYTGLQLGDKVWTKVVVFFEGQGLSGEKFLTSAEFLISPRTRVSLSNKTQFKSIAGVFSWATSIDELPQWFKDKGAIRPAYEGEEELLSFFVALGNLDTYSEGSVVEFSDWEKLCAGDVTELKEYIFTVAAFHNLDVLENFIDTRSVNGLLYVQNAKYMRVYNGAFCTQEDSACNKIVKKIQSLTKPLESIESGNLNMVVFKPDIKVTTTVESLAPEDLPF
jgi:hypothetical protein